MLRILFLLLMILLFRAEYVPSGKNIPRVHTVEIKGMHFVPEVLQVKKGDTVIWINKDLFVHNVTEKSGAWSSTAISRQGRWKKRIQASADYFCSLHPVMKGSITVK